MVLVRQDYDVLTAHQTILDNINSSLGSKMADVDFDQLFEVRDTTKRRQTEKLTHGMSGIQRVAENQDYPEITGEEGASISWIQAKFGGDVVVTEDVRIFDEYDILDGEIDSVTDDLQSKLQASHYDVLNNGRSTSYTDVYGDTISAVWPDGLALFSTVHHKHTGVGSAGGTFSNILNDGTYVNPELSFVALDKGRQVGKLFYDSHTVRRPINFNELLVWPDLETLAHRIVDSDRMYGTGNNDVNPLKGRFKITVSPEIDTGKWFMLDSKNKGKTFKSFFRTRPMVKSPKEFDPNDNWHYIIKTRYAYGFSYAPFVLGSKGTNAS